MVHNRGYNSQLLETRFIAFHKTCLCFKPFLSNFEYVSSFLSVEEYKLKIKL